MQRNPQSTDVGLFDWAGWLAEIPTPIRRDDRFKLVEILGVLSRDRFFAALNENRDSPQRSFKLKPRSALGNAIRLSSAVVSMSAQLRLYVDEWLDTGVSPQGVENPSARDLTKAPN